MNIESLLKKVEEKEDYILYDYGTDRNIKLLELLPDKDNAIYEFRSTSHNDMYMYTYSLGPYQYDKLKDDVLYKQQFLKENNFSIEMSYNESYDCDLRNEELYLLNIQHSIGGGNNFYHFIHQYFPKIYLYFLLKPNNPNLKLLFNIDKATKWQIELLDILGIKNDDIINRKGNIKKFKRAYLPNYPQLRELNPLIYEFYRHKIVDPICRLKYNIIPPTKFFILKKENKNTCGGDRYIININDVTEVLNDFVDYNERSYSLREQIYVYHNAKYIIFDNGATIVNIIYFTNPNVKVLVISPSCPINNVNDVTLKLVSKYNHKVFYDTYIDKNDTNFKKYNAPYYIDISKFKNMYFDFIK